MDLVYEQLRICMQFRDIIQVQDIMTRYHSQETHDSFFPQISDRKCSDFSMRTVFS